MEYQKMINLLDNTSKSKTKSWVEINDDSRWTFSTSSKIKFKTMMLNSSLFDYSDAYILTQVDNAKDADIVMPM